MMIKKMIPPLALKTVSKHELNTMMTWILMKAFQNILVTQQLKIFSRPTIQMNLTTVMVVNLIKIQNI